MESNKDDYFVKLIKGDINNLEGKVTAFSKIGDEEFLEATQFPRIIALYGCTNILDFLDKKGLPLEDADKILDSSKEAIDELTQKLNEKIKNIGIEIKLVRVYATPLIIEDEAELYACKEDVIDVGSYYNVASSLDAIKKGIDFYFLKFEDGLKKKHNIQNGLGKEGEIGKETRKEQVNYKSVKKGSLKKHMLDNFVVPMLDCRKYGQDKSADSIRLGFFRFCEGSPFITDAFKVVELVDAKHNNLDMINSYLDKIEAINSEDYMAAAKIRDRIIGKK